METAELFPVFGPLHADESVTSKDALPATAQPIPFVISSRKKGPRRRAGVSRSIDRDLKVLTELMNPDFLADDPDGAAFDLERALRSIAFLLDYASGRGNKQLEAIASQGLSMILKECADDVRLIRPVRP